MRILRYAAIGAALAALGFAAPANAQSYGYGPGYGMMGGGYGPGWGMMRGYGPGYGMGPGMMGGYGPGWGRGPMMGPGYGPGMMGPGYGAGYGPGYGRDLNLTTDNVKKLSRADDPQPEPQGRRGQAAGRRRDRRHHRYQGEG